VINIARRYHSHQVTKTDGIYSHKITVTHRSVFGKTEHKKELDSYGWIMSVWTSARLKIKELGGSVRKYRKRIFVGAVPTLVGLLTILSLIPGVQIYGLEDITCKEYCDIPFQVCTNYYDIIFREDVQPFYFDKDVQLIGMVDSNGEDFSFSGKTLRVGECWNITATVKKERWDDVKYGFRLHGIDIDPMLYADHWVSSSDWLYVRQNGNTIETVYGNFSYDKGAIVMTKNGEEMGKLNIGKVGSIKTSKDVIPDIICNEKERTCDMTIGRDDEKIILNFDKFRVKINYEYTNNQLSAESPKFQFELETNSKIKSESNTSIVFDNGMSFDYSDIQDTELLDKSEYKDKKLTIETKTVNLGVGEKVVLDPGWTSPSSIIDSSESSGGGDTGNIIDGNTGTEWSCTSSFSCDNPAFVIMDLGDTYYITKSRGYMDGNSYQDTCGWDEIFVCDDAACSGENSLGRFDTASSTETWQEHDHTDATGRYIKLNLFSYHFTGGCSIISYYVDDFFEFEAYSDTLPDNTPPNVDFISPTNTNGTETYGKDYITWNISVNEDIGLGKIEINGTNQTCIAVNATTNSYCYYNETGFTTNVTRCSEGHATDASNNWNTTLNTICRNMQVAEAVGDTCDCPASGDWTIDCTENCEIDSACDVQGNDVIFTGSGNIWVSAEVSNIGNTTLSSGCNITLASGVNWTL